MTGPFPLPFRTSRRQHPPRTASRPAPSSAPARYEAPPGGALKCIRREPMCLSGAYPKVLSVPDVYISSECGRNAVDCGRNTGSAPIGRVLRSHLVGSLRRNQLPNATEVGGGATPGKQVPPLHCLSYLFLRAASLASISTAEESVSSSAN